MPTTVHILDVGQGNMVFIEADNGRNFVFDCNITDEKSDDVFWYLAEQMESGTPIDEFICSHRDADHIRGIDDLHSVYPIKAIWDSDYPGTTTDSSEYKAYMALRRELKSGTIARETHDTHGRTHFRFMSAKDDRMPNNANAQGIVLKVEHLSSDGARVLSSVMLPGDSDALTWRNGIVEDYGASDLKSSILLASHHGSLSFFDDPNDSERYYVDHIKAIDPNAVVISVGHNSHGHPKSKAISLYEKYCSGTNKGNKVFRTDKKGNIKITLKDSGESEIHFV